MKALILYFSIILLTFPLIAFGQKGYKSVYKSGFYLETWGVSRGISANYNPILYSNQKGFLASSIGISYVWGSAEVLGEPNPFGFQKSGIGFPMTLTYNYSLGNLGKKLKSKVSNKCITRPPKLLFDWFLEGGVQTMPAFYKKQPNEIGVSAYTGGRIQMKIRRPYKQNDLVVFIRAGYLPVMYRSSKKVGVRVFPNQSDVFGGSLGFGI